MFPRLRHRLSAAVLDRIDVLVEFSTLGEYGLAEDGLPIAAEAETVVAAPAVAPRSRGRCSRDGRLSPLRPLPARR